MTDFHRKRGFSLIELMIVVAIIGILAAIAIPAYMNYTTRAQVSEGLTLAGGLKVSMAETFAERGQWPSTSLDAGLDGASAGKYVESLQAVDGVIVITYGRQASTSITDRVLALAPGVATTGEILWVCGEAPRPTVDGGITWQGDAAAVTTIEQKYLSASCRSRP